MRNPLSPLEAKVVELKENKPVGVPGVVVSVSGESYDITAPDGSFKLTALKVGLCDDYY